MPPIRFFSTLVLILLLNLAYAQPFVGLKTSYVSSGLVGTSDDRSLSFDNQAGWGLAMVFSSRVFNSPIGGSIEPGYLQKGAKVRDSLHYKFHYMNLPILFHFYLSNRISVQLGPEIAYLIKARDVSTSPLERLKNIYDHRFDFSGSASLNIGLTYYIDIGFKYNSSFIKVSSRDPYTGHTNLKNQYLELFLILKLYN